MVWHKSFGVVAVTVVATSSSSSRRLGTNMLTPDEREKEKVKNGTFTFHIGGGHSHTNTTPATRTHIDILYINCIYHFLFPIWNSVWNFRLHNTHTEYTHHNRTCEPNRFVKPTTCVRKSNFQNCPNLRVALYYIHALCLWSTLYFSAPLSRKWSSFPPTLQNAVRYGRTTQQWLQRMQNVVNGANRKPRREHERRMVGRRVSVKETKSACNMGTKTRNRREKKYINRKCQGI